MSFFDNLNQLLGQYPINESFIEGMRERVRKECSKVPVHVHKRAGAQEVLELAARQAIVAFWQETFVDAWFPVTMRPDWPWAHCIITKNKAVIEFSFGPETDGHRGGKEIEPVEIQVQRAPANIITRTLRRFEERDLKAEREPILPPTGTPDGRPELKLKEPIAAAPKAENMNPAKGKALPAGMRGKLNGRKQ